MPGPHLVVGLDARHAAFLQQAEHEALQHVQLVRHLGPNVRRAADHVLGNHSMATQSGHIVRSHGRVIQQGHTVTSHIRVTW